MEREASAQAVREERERLGWTQELLAKKAGCDVRTVRRLEAGTRVKATTVAEITSALRRARPAAEGKAPAPAAAPQAPNNENGMLATPSTDPARRRTVEPAAQPVPELETAGELMELAKADPKAAEAYVETVVRGFFRQEETSEKLSMGYQVVEFIERFPDSQVYVLWDVDDAEPVRKMLAEFIGTATALQNSIRDATFDSAQRFSAQCAFADQLAVLHKASWHVAGVVTRETDLDGYTASGGRIVIDFGF